MSAPAVSCYIAVHHTDDPPRPAGVQAEEFLALKIADLEIPWPEGMSLKEAFLAWKWKVE